MKKTIILVLAMLIILSIPTFVLASGGRPDVVGGGTKIDSAGNKTLFSILSDGSEVPVLARSSVHYGPDGQEVIHDSWWHYDHRGLATADAETYARDKNGKGIRHYTRSRIVTTFLELERFDSGRCYSTDGYPEFSYASCGPCNPYDGFSMRTNWGGVW